MPLQSSPSRAWCALLPQLLRLRPETRWTCSYASAKMAIEIQRRQTFQDSGAQDDPEVRRQFPSWVYLYRLICEQISYSRRSGSNPRMPQPFWTRIWGGGLRMNRSAISSAGLAPCCLRYSGAIQSSRLLRQPRSIADLSLDSRHPRISKGEIYQRHGDHGGLWPHRIAAESVCGHNARARPRWVR